MKKEDSQPYNIPQEDLDFMSVSRSLRLSIDSNGAWKTAQYIADNFPELVVHLKTCLKKRDDTNGE